MNKIIALTFDDWTAIYANGELEYEGHSIPQDIMLKIGRKYPTSEYQSVYIDEGEQEELELWDMPEKLNGLPNEVLNKIK